MKTAQIGSATLYCADCRDILPTLNDISAILVDPPYGIKYTSGHATEMLWKGRTSIKGDKNTAMRDEALELCERFEAPTLCFGSWKAAAPKGTRHRLIWDKGPALGMGDLSLPWKPTAEDIYIIGKGFVGKRDEGSVMRFSPVQSMAKNGRRHPNEKPVKLLRHLMRKLPEGTILDMFMGSGSTGEAAILEGRKFIGIEFMPDFFEDACQRLHDVVSRTTFKALEE